MAPHPNLIAQNATPLMDITGFTTGFTAPTVSPDARLATLVTNIVTVFTIFAGISFLFWFVIGAFTWITAAGKADQMEKAKSQMSTALVGLIVVILTTPLAYIIGKLIGIEILNPQLIIQRLIN